jgi:16S rRNA (guanine527-N7)-methyltransferase
LETILQNERLKFDIYVKFLKESNEKFNLTAVPEQNTEQRHFNDCLSLLAVCDFKNKKVIDVGSGAGFPGVPLKIAEPTIALTLLDAQQKRVAFLQQLLSILEIDASAIHTRAEELSRKFAHREQYDIAVSRAVAKLNVLSELCLPFVRPGGCFIAQKGANCEPELEEALTAISELGGGIQSIVSYEYGTIVLISKKSATPDKYPRSWKKIARTPL